MFDVSVSQRRAASSRLFALLPVLIAGFGGSIRQAPPVFRSASILVEVDAMVTDCGGRFVQDLAPEDFEIVEGGRVHPVETLYLVADGRTRAITPKSAEPSAVPPPIDAAKTRRLFILFFDLEHMQEGSVRRAKEAAAAFLQRDFLDTDVGAVIAAGQSADRVPVGNRESVAGALAAVRATSEFTQRQRQITGEWPRMTALEAYLVTRRMQPIIDEVVNRARADQEATTDNAEDMVRKKAREVVAEAETAARRTLATLAGLVEQLARVPGRKNVVFLSDGFQIENATDALRQAVGTAARASVRIYSMDTRGLNRGTASSDVLTARLPDTSSLARLDLMSDGLNSLAVDTGGLVARNENDFRKVLHEFAVDCAAYDVLGYRPADTRWDGRFREINVRVKRPELQVRARRGYLATPPTAIQVLPVEPSPVPAPVGSVPIAAPTPAPPAEPVGVLLSRAPLGDAPASSIDPAAVRLRPWGSSSAADAARLRGGDPSAIPAALPASYAIDARVGWDAYQRGDTKAARAALGPVATHPAAPPWVHYVLGWAQFAERDFSRASVAWTRVRGAVPEFQPVYFDLADSYWQQRKRQEALDVLKEAEKRWPTSLDVLNALGVASVSTGAVDDAIVWFEKATSAQPNDETSQFNRAGAAETRFVMALRTGSAPDQSRLDALERYRLLAAAGGSLSEAARAGIRRLESLDARTLAFGAPTAVATLGAEMLHGRACRLAWAADGRQLYVAGIGGTEAMPTEGHILVSVPDGTLIADSTQPEWTRAYWRWKAAQRAPWLPAISIKAETRRMTGFNMADPGSRDRVYAPVDRQSVSNVLTLHNQVIAESSTTSVIPGLSFGWAPFAMGAIAYVDPQGRLVIMDAAGRKVEVPGVVDALLPAWSEDGGSIAYLQIRANAYVVTLVTVGEAKGGRR